MPNEVPSLTPNLQAPKVESSVLTLSSLGDWDRGKFEGIWFMGSDRKKQGESQEGPPRLVDDTQSHQIDIKKSATKNWEILRTLDMWVDQVVQSMVKALKHKSKGKEKVNVTQEKEEEESSLLVVLADEHANMLLQGVSGVFSHDDMWYLDTRVKSHMNVRKSFY